MSEPHVPLSGFAPSARKAEKRPGPALPTAQLALLTQAAEALDQAESSESVISTLLASISRCGGVPYCAFFRSDGESFVPHAEHGALGGASTARLVPSGIEQLDRGAAGSSCTLTVGAGRPIAAICVSFPLPEDAAAFVAFGDEQRDEAELRSLLPVVQELVRTARRRIEHLIATRTAAETVKDLEAQLAQRTEELEHARRALAAEVEDRRRTKIALRQAAAVFENTTEAVLITDPSENILWVNRAFTHVTGYSADEAVGKTPRFLQSGHHDKTFYASMWEAIRANGHWKGEIWNRRKDGVVYPELLNITAVKNEGGAVTHFVALFSDISSRREAGARIERLAHYDPLTDLPNRLLFQARLEHAAAQAKRLGHRVAVLILGVDGFKNLNQTLGLPAGDELLRTVAGVLSRNAREGDTVARLAGDEFVVLFEDLDDAQVAATAARRTLESVAGTYQVEGRELFITCSGGMSIFPDDDQDLAALLRNAHAAFHRAKQSGRNTCQFYTAEMRLLADERFHIEADLRRAVRRDELLLHFQPQFSMSTGECVGFEALSRWDHPERGLLSPKGFIDIAEETGVIDEIGSWALGEACRHAVEWAAAGRSYRVSVNLSAREIARTPVQETVARALRDSGLPHACLELEITEGSLLERPEEAFRTLRELKELGVTLAIDDFGTGYSSLSYLKLLPVDKLKIDQSFVRDITLHPDDAAIARTIITLAHGLHLKVTAEGVETEEQAAFLREHGCDEVQGFLFGTPMPASEVARFVRNGR